MAFELPKNAEIYVDQVLERSKHLINSGIWRGLSEVRLDTWIKNFEGDKERYFMACVLDALIFRSEEQTLALIEQLFQRVLPDFLRKRQKQNGSEKPWLEMLRQPSSNSPQLRIIPVVKDDDSPTKSGPALTRLYKRHFGINENWIIYPNKIEEAKGKGVNHFLMVDDFLGTGKQFAEFADNCKLRTRLSDCFAVYSPLVAHSTGVSKIVKSHNYMHVVSVEQLDDKFNLFSTESEWFNDEINSSESAKDFYYDMVKRFDFSIKPDDMEGVGGLSLAYAFDHGTPDNCLPIFWASGKNWNPLLVR